MIEFIKEQLSGAVRFMTESYVKDVAALGADKMSDAPGGSARVAWDYSYEVAFVGRRIAARLRMENPPEWPWKEGYAIAPEEFRTVDAISAELTAAGEEVCAAIMAADESTFRHEWVFGEDFKMSGFQMAMHAVDHISYHLGQLNQLQMLNGDAEVHWG